MNTTISGQDKFNFFVPATFEKGKDDKGNVVTWIEGIASTSTVKDSDQETLFPSGFDFAPLLASGFFNYNHKANVTSKAIVGQPTEAKVINSGRDFWVKGFIYPNEEGRNIVELHSTLKQFSPDRNIGFSIEGTATSRDPFDNKKITGAVITGIALTVSPKNKNTLMNIIKGEYAEPFVVEDETEKECVKCGHKNTADSKCKCIIKDMTTAAIAPAMPEHVEHNPKEISNNNAKEFGSLLKKSDIYTLIINKYNSTIAETKQIFSLVQKTNQNLFSMNTTDISKEALQKSFDLLDEAMALVKGKDADPILNVEAASEEDIQKSTETASILMKAGMDKVAACDVMVKGGISLTVAQGAYESVLASANADKQGGKITAETAPIVKSEDAETMLPGVDVAEEIKKSIDPINEALLKGFEGLNGLVKILTEQNIELVKGNTEFSERLSKFESGSQGRKSITTTAVDRFSKSNESTELKAGEECINVDLKVDLAKLVTRLDAENENIVSKGKEPDSLLIKAIESIEICNVVPPEAYARIRSMGIILQSAKAQ